MANYNNETISSDSLYVEKGDTATSTTIRSKGHVLVFHGGIWYNKVESMKTL